MIKLSNKSKWFLRILVIVSWTILSLFCTIDIRKKIVLINSFIVFIILLIFIKKIKIPEIINKKDLIISALVSCYVDKIFMSNAGSYILKYQAKFIRLTNIKFIMDIVYFFISLLIFPVLFFLVYNFFKIVYPKIINEIKKFTTVEKRFVIISLIVSTILVVSVSLMTSAFQVPIYNNVIQKYDIIFTSDSSDISNFDAWTNLKNAENDIRQPLFAVFSLPIGIFCHMVSELLFFIPSNFSYYTVMSIIQFILLAITTILISRLINIREEDKKYFYLFFSLSFPYILFGLVLEQYVMGLFYLILTIYYYENNKEKINYLYLGAVGTLLTSGIMIPFITKFTNIWDWIKKVLKCFITFVLILILSGQFAQIFTLKTKIIQMMRFTGSKVSFIDKFNQFTYYIESLFFSVKGVIKNNNFGSISYQLVPIETISIIGIIIFLLVFISMIINRKNKMCLISFGWVLFSIFILLIVGWGTQENGQILYSLYFAWAYYSLYFMLLYKIKNKNIFKVLIMTTIIVMLYSTSIEMFDIFKFAIYYFSR